MDENLRVPPEIKFSNRTDRLEDEQFHPGQVFAKSYRIIRPIGRGGMGTIYEVEQTFLHKKFALKTLNKNSVTETSWKRFLKEAKAANSLDHPGLVKVHDFGITDDGAVPFMVMDLVDGDTIAELLAKGGPLLVDDAIEIFVQTCEALGFAHTRGIIHRDIKPSNIMVTHMSGKIGVKIVDFGIAKMISNAGMESIALTKTGDIFGTPQYMSPEQCLGLAIDHRSDIYSVGCALFEALTGTPPFVGDSVLAIMMRHHNETAPTLSEATLGKEFPRQLEKVIARLLDKKIESRYQTLYQVASDLRRVQNNAEISSPEVAQDSEDRNWNILMYSILGIMLIAIPAIAFFISEIQTAPPEIPSPKVTGFVPGLEVDKWLPQRGQYYSAFNKEHPENRVFNFPRYESAIGLLSWKPQTEVFIYRNGELTNSRGRRMPAEGVFIMNKFKPLEVRLDESGMVNPRLLAAFRPDEIQDLICSDESSVTITKSVTDDFFEQIPHFDELTLLDVSGGKIGPKALKYISSCQKLNFLKLNRTPITYDDIAALRCLSKLGTIDVSGPRKGDISLFLKRLATMDQRFTLWIENAPALTNSSLGIIADDINLVELDIDNNPQITAQGIKRLAKSHVESILMSRCSIGPEVVETVRKLPKLQHIKISEDGWTDAQKKALADAFRPPKVLEVFEQIDEHVKARKFRDSAEFYSRPEDARL